MHNYLGLSPILVAKDTISDRIVLFTFHVWKTFHKQLWLNVSLSYDYHQQFDGYVKQFSKDIRTITAQDYSFQITKIKAVFIFFLVT